MEERRPLRLPPQEATAATRERAAKGLERALRLIAGVRNGNLRPPGEAGVAQEVFLRGMRKAAASLATDLLRTGVDGKKRAIEIVGWAHKNLR